MNALQRQQHTPSPSATRAPFSAGVEVARGPDGVLSAPASTATASERAIVGAMMEDPRAGPAAAHAGLTPAHFADANLASLYAALQARLADALPCDAPTVAAALQGQVSAATLEQCLEAAPATFAHAAYHAGQIMEAASRRRVRDTLAAGLSRLTDASESPGMVAGETAALLSDMGAAAPSAGPEVDNAASVLTTPDEHPPMIAAGLFGPGDLVQIVSTSKGRKTFALLQLAMSVASGTPFLGHTVEAHPVAFLNLEIRPAYFRQRMRRMARALGLSGLLKELRIVHARGLPTDTALARLRAEARAIGAGMVIVDPVYCLSSGEENSSEQGKYTVALLNALAAGCGAAVAYSHHTAKGSPADRAAVDRGAGSNVLARAYDASLSILAHASEPDTFVIEWSLRNFAPAALASIRWNEGCFVLAPGVEPVPETARSRLNRSATQRPGMDTDTLTSKATALLHGTALPLAVFKTKIMDKLHVGERRSRDIIEAVRSQPGYIVAKQKAFGGQWFIGPAALVAERTA